MPSAAASSGPGGIATSSSTTTASGMPRTYIRTPTVPGPRTHLCTSAASAGCDTLCSGGAEPSRCSSSMRTPSAALSVTDRRPSGGRRRPRCRRPGRGRHTTRPSRPPGRRPLRPSRSVPTVAGHRPPRSAGFFRITCSSEVGCTRDFRWRVSPPCRTACARQPRPRRHAAHGGVRRQARHHRRCLERWCGLARRRRGRQHPSPASFLALGLAAGAAWALADTTLFAEPSTATRSSMSPVMPPDRRRTVVRCSAAARQ